MKNFSNLLKIIFLLALIGGTAGLSFTLVSRHLQTQEKQKVEQAKNFLDQKQYPAAIAVYDELLEKDTAQAHFLWINRGYAWAGLTKYDEMLQSCSNAAELEPKEALAWNCRGEALYNLGQYEAALKNFNQALNLNSRLGIVWLNQSRVLADLNQYRQAIAASEQGIKILFKSPRKNSDKPVILAIAFNQQGQSWLKLKQNKKALIAFNQSLEYLHNYLPAQQGQGIALYRLGFYARATKVFTGILQRNDLTQEQQAISWLYKGISLCGVANATEASQAFEQVVKLTTNPQALVIAKAGCGIR